MIVRNAKIVRKLADTFEADWSAKRLEDEAKVTPREIKKALKATVEKLSPLDPLVKEAVEEVVSKTDGSAKLNTQEMKETVENAVKEAVRERVQEMVNETVEQEQ